MGQSYDKSPNAPSAIADLCFGEFMPNDVLVPTGQRFQQPTPPQTMALNQGDCIQLADSSDLFQVIGIDDCNDRCWVRRWPLQSAGGSHVFEVSLGQIHQTVASDHHENPQAVATRP